MRSVCCLKCSSRRGWVRIVVHPMTNALLGNTVAFVSTENETVSSDMTIRDASMKSTADNDSTTNISPPEEKEDILADEVVHNVRLKSLSCEKDRTIMLKDIKDLTDEEVERRLYLANVNQSDSEKQWNERVIRGNYRSKLLDINPEAEKDEKEQALDLGIHFFGCIDTVLPLFKAREIHTLAKGIAMHRRDKALTFYSKEDVAASRRARTHVEQLREDQLRAIRTREREKLEREYLRLSFLGKVWYWVQTIVQVTMAKRISQQNEYNEE